MGAKLSEPEDFPLDVGALHMLGLAVAKELGPHLIPFTLDDLDTDPLDNSAAKVPPQLFNMPPVSL